MSAEFCRGHGTIGFELGDENRVEDTPCTWKVSRLTLERRTAGRMPSPKAVGYGRFRLSHENRVAEYSDRAQ
jgi:hypothetical protein